MSSSQNGLMWMCRLKTSTGSSWNSCGIFLYTSASRPSTGSTHDAPCSITATFSAGNRESMPWQIIDATASSTGRHSATCRNALGLKGRNSRVPPSQSLA